MKLYLLAIFIIIYYALAAILLKPYLGDAGIVLITKIKELVWAKPTSTSVTGKLPGNWPPTEDKASFCIWPDKIDLLVFDTTQPITTLFDNLGKLEHPITTQSTQAQAFFNQGLRLVYGFNHYEAYKSFLEAARLDSTCAMAYWGQALAMAPNINSPIDKERSRLGYQAIQKALSYKSNVSKAERAYIEAMAMRFSSQEEINQSQLDAAYALAMAKLATKYPNDPDAGTLYADALMNRMPWDYWTVEGNPRPGIDKAISTLEKVISQFPDHPGAHHLYIHVVEASTNPDRGVSSADRLAALMPGSGHLVHMPSHIYLRVGRYAETAQSNLKAMAVDEEYLAKSQMKGKYSMHYYPHNIHFAWAGAIMQGNSDLSLTMAQKASSKANREIMADQSILQTFYILPVYTFIRFGKWNELLTEPYPGKKLYHASAMWHYGRGLAFAATGQLEQAQQELSILDSLSKEPQIKDDYLSANLVAIASKNIGGEIAAKKQQYTQAIQLLKEGVQLEDNLRYSEPRSWPQPLRHTLGAVLLEANLAKEAEQVYREDLTIHRENGWSLFGLKQSLLKQGKEQEAAQAEQLFNKAWALADITPTNSRY